MNMFKFRSLSLMVVHRHIAASSSNNPFSTGQQTFSTGFPNPICTKPPSTSTHSPNLSALIGQVGCEVVGGGFSPFNLVAPNPRLPSSSVGNSSGVLPLYQLITKMAHCTFQRNAFVGCEETRGSAFFSDPKDLVVCPRPRRVGILSINPTRSSRLQMSLQSEVCESKAGADLLDIILMKEGYQEEQSTAHVAASPPYFCGSPPSRAANPLVHDARFGDEKLASFQALPSPTRSGFSSPSSARKGGCVRMKFGLKPAAVRVEGFDCLNRDRQNSSIPAVA